MSKHINCIHEYITKYNDALLASDEPLKYLKTQRGLTEETIKLFNIGFCSESFDVPGSTVNEKIFNKQNLKNKIVIPIYSEFGDFLAFCARSYLPQNKGWWHQPFDKSNCIFGLHLSKEYGIITGKLYVVEGFFDVICMYQQGIKNVCAIMGTALGYRKIGLLARYCEYICLCYDEDKKNNAGQLARIKSIYELHQYGWNNISYISLPIGVDPDEFILKHSVDEFYQLEKPLTKSQIIEISQKYVSYIEKK